MRLAIALALAIGCSDSKPERAPSGQPPAPARTAPPAEKVTEAVRDEVAILVDGRPVAGVSRTRISEPVELSALTDVPPADWKVAEGFVSEHRRLALRKPLESYPDQKVMLFSDESGKPCFGLFLREDKAPPASEHLLGKPRLFVRGIVEVRIRTQEDAVKEVEPPALEVVVGVDLTKLSGEKIRALPPAAMPDSSGQTYWSVSAIVGLVNARRPQSVVAIAGDRTEIEISSKALRDPEQIVALKLNRRGLYKLVWWDASQKPGKVVSEARDIRRLEVR